MYVTLFTFVTRARYAVVRKKALSVLFVVVLCIKIGVKRLINGINVK